MTATTLPAPADARVSVTFPRAVRSEWIKLRTLRSTVWCYALIVLLTLGMGLVLAANGMTNTGGLDPYYEKQWAVQVSTMGLNFTQLIAAVLGVLIISGEYSTGMIRSTFAAVPKRLPALFAKVLVLGVTTFVIGLVAIVATALVTAPILASNGIHADYLDPGVVLALLGGAGYLALIAMVAFGFGAILRNSAGGIATSLALILVVPTVILAMASLMQATWLRNVAAFLPSSAGTQMYTLAEPQLLNGMAVQQVGPGSEIITLDGIQGLLVMLAWVVVTIGIASVLLKRRDA